jgi:hypothetical protein
MSLWKMVLYIGARSHGYQKQDRDKEKENLKRVNKVLNFYIYQGIVLFSTCLFRLCSFFFSQAEIYKTTINHIFFLFLFLFCFVIVFFFYLFFPSFFLCIYYFSLFYIYLHSSFPFLLFSIIIIIILYKP